MTQIKTYILKCSSGEYYCGKSIDISRRLIQHKEEESPHFFCNSKRKDFKLVFKVNMDVEDKIKRFGVKAFIEMQRKAETPNGRGLLRSPGQEESRP